MIKRANNNSAVDLAPVVLLVDADPAARELMQRALSQTGMTVLLSEAIDGATGAAALLELREDINVIVLDLQTIGETVGDSLLGLHRQLIAAQRGIQLILIGDPSAVQDLAECLRRDATDFLPKPILRRILLYAVLEAHRRHLAWLGQYGIAMQGKVSGRPPLPGAELRTLQILTELDDYRVRSFSGLVETDTTWLMLTELLRARLLGRRISVTSLCLASRGPITTALRRIGKLQRAGLLTYVRDPQDRRRKYIDLTANGALRVQEVVQTIARQLRGENATEWSH
jgi:CheY-like chemotaxis protein/DNA-binding MarR family transcriptional regulator